DLSSSIGDEKRLQEHLQLPIQRLNDYQLLLRLPETSLGSLEDPRQIELLHIEGEAHPHYPLLLQARTPECRDAWLEGVKEYVVETASVDDLLFDDDIRIVSEDGDEVDERGHAITPAPDDQDLSVDDKDLPLDDKDLPVDDQNLPVDQLVPTVNEDLLPKEDIPIEVEFVPKARRIPIEVEEVEKVEQDHVVPQDQKLARTKGEEESSPLPQRKKAKADLLEQVETFDSIYQEGGQYSTVYSEETVESSSVYRRSSTTFKSQTSIVESTSGFQKSTSTFGSKVDDQVDESYRQVEIVKTTQADNDYQLSGGYQLSVSSDKSSDKSDGKIRDQQQQQQEQQDQVREFFSL
ncbi:uncharacterized protein LOC108675709, partial [Hyalella azteca]|uniref:Uncharacterized protein LOC108675709 n=1 Tax=Hyalella azteca TaxID=294128 RepID=A0A8B7NZM4_HYAAZ